MKEVLSRDEIIDLVEDLENLVSRACREKRRQYGNGDNSKCTTTASPAGADVCRSTCTHGSSRRI